MSENLDLHVNPDGLTLGDLEDFEDYVGKPLQEAIKEQPVLDADGKKVFDETGRPETQVAISSKALVGLVWITKRSTDPSFTVERARGISVGSLVIHDDTENDAKGDVMAPKDEPQS